MDRWLTPLGEVEYFRDHRRFRYRNQRQALEAQLAAQQLGAAGAKSPVRAKGRKARGAAAGGAEAGEQAAGGAT